MNIITNADVEKFIKLLKAGIKNGQKKDMKTYTSIDCYDGTHIPKEYYISLEFKFVINADKVDELFLNEDAGLTSQINDMLDQP